MKKLFFVLILLLFIIAISGCASVNYSTLSSIPDATYEKIKPVPNVKNGINYVFVSHPKGDRYEDSDHLITINSQLNGLLVELMTKKFNTINVDSDDKIIIRIQDLDYDFVSGLREGLTGKKEGLHIKMLVEVEVGHNKKNIVQSFKHETALLMLANKSLEERYKERHAAYDAFIMYYVDEINKFIDNTYGTK